MSNFFEIKSVGDAEEKNQMMDHSQKKRTSDYMTKYEYTRLIASRAVEIENGFIPKVNIEDDPEEMDANNEDKVPKKYNPYEIARMELHARVIPLVIIRTLEDGTKETWHIKDMHIRDY